MRLNNFTHARHNCGGGLRCLTTPTWYQCYKYLQQLAPRYVAAYAHAGGLRCLPMPTNASSLRYRSSLCRRPSLPVSTLAAFAASHAPAAHAAVGCRQWHRRLCRQCRRLPLFGALRVSCGGGIQSTGILPSTLPMAASVVATCFNDEKRPRLFRVPVSLSFKS